MGDSLFKIDVDLGRLLSDVNAKLYESSEVVIDELVQNAQRSGARRLEVRLAEGYSRSFGALVVRDDGCGLSSPTDLLRLAHSGWSEEVSEREEPFGMGFWSTVTVAEKVIVRSNGWRVELDAARLRTTRSVEGVVNVSVLDTPVPGFEVTLIAPMSARTEERYVDVTVAASEQGYRLMRAWQRLTGGLAERLADLVRYADFDRVTMSRTRWVSSYESLDEALGALGALGDADESVIPSRLPLTAAPEGIVFARSVSSPRLHGVLWPQQNSYSREAQAWHSGLRWFTQRREVEKRDGSFGGVVHVEAGVADPRAPDRKAWVRNERYEGMMVELDGEIRQMYRSFLTERPDLADRYDDALSRHLDGDDLLELLPVVLEQDEAAVARAAAAKEVSAQKAVGTDWPEPPERSPVTAPELDLPDDLVAVSTMSIVEQTPPRKSVTRLRDLGIELAVYVESDRRSDHARALALAREVGLPVLLLPSRCSARVVEALRKEGATLLHVSLLGASIVEEFRAEKTPMESEVAGVWRSARRLLERAFATDASIDARHLTRSRTLVVKDEDQELVRRSLESAETALLGCAFVGGALIVELEHVKGAVARSTPGSENRALQVALELLPTVAHEMAHLETGAGDGTVEHASAAERLMTDALRRIAREL